MTELTPHVSAKVAWVTGNVDARAAGPDEIESRPGLEPGCSSRWVRA